MTRVIYASNSVLISDMPGLSNFTGLYDIKALDRIQSASVSISNNISRYKQIGFDEFGFNNFYGTPKISCSLDYYCTDSSNESCVGINTDGNKSIYYGFDGANKNVNLFFLSDYIDGRDLATVANYSGVNVFGLGNACLTRYSVKGSIQEPPTVSLAFDANNILFDTYTGINLIPSFNTLANKTGGYYYSIFSGVFDKSRYVSNQSARPIGLRPADIIVELSQPEFAGGIYQTTSGKIQDFSIDIPFDRKDLEGFGDNFTFDKKLMFPSVGSVSFKAIFDDIYKNNHSGIFNFSDGNNIKIKLQDCSGNDTITYTIKKAKQTSESFSISIGNSMLFDGSFEFAVGAKDGFIISGSAQKYDSDAFNFLKSIDSYDPTIRYSINEFVKDLKSNGLWYKMSGIYPFVGGTSGSHKFNLKDPRDSNSAFRLGFSGTGMQNTSSGIYFSGANDYANTFFNPYNHLSGYPVHLSALFLSDQDSTSVDIGCMPSDGSRPRLSLVTESSGFGGAIFDCFDYVTGRSLISGSINSQAFYTASRTSITGQELLIFRSSTSPIASNKNILNISGQPLPNFNVYLGATNLGGTSVGYPNSSNRQFGFFSFGDGLTSGECVNLYSSVKRLQNNLGRNSSVFV